MTLNVNEQIQRITGARKSKLFTESGQISANPGDIITIFVSSSSAGSIKLWNSLDASGIVLVDTFTAVGGQSYNLPYPFTIGCYLTITGTLTCTVGWNE